MLGMCSRPCIPQLGTLSATELAPFGAGTVRETAPVPQRSGKDDGASGLYVHQACGALCQCRWVDRTGRPLWVAHMDDFGVFIHRVNRM